MKLNTLELLSGVGGLALGLHQAGFRPKALVELDTRCIETLKKNIGIGRPFPMDTALIGGDIRKLDFRKFAGKVHLISGGPPCQPFSVGGRGAAYSDSRNMFPEAIRAVAETMPLAFFFENVPGLTQKKNKHYFEYLLRFLKTPAAKPAVAMNWQEHDNLLRSQQTSDPASTSGYSVYTALVNAADYGIPQVRRRLFIAGIRRDLGLDWQFPAPTHSASALENYKSTGGYWARHGQSAANYQSETAYKSRDPESLDDLQPWRTIRDSVSDLGQPRMGVCFEDFEGLNGHTLHPGARSYDGHTGSTLDHPSKTLKAGVHGVPGGENMVVLDDGTVRYLTIRECARIQSFPDHFLFTEAWSSSMRQIGNAVPPHLAYALAAKLCVALTPHAHKL